MLNRLLTALAIVLASQIFIAPAAQADTITVTDVLDRQVEIPANAQRILLGFYFEDFYAIGGPDAYDRVVAISKSTWEGWRNSQWKTYLDINPKIGQLIDVGEIDSGTFSLETAVAAKPDVAILAAWQYNGLGTAVQKLEAAGIPVLVADYNAQTVARHVTSTLMLGRVLGAEDRAQALADQYRTALADIGKRVSSAGGDIKKVYVELGKKGPSEVGNSYGDTMWGEVIKTSGGDNIASGKIEKWGQLNPEYILASNPEAVFIAGSDWANSEQAVLMGFGQTTDVTQSRLAPYAERVGWSNLKAIKDGELHAIYHGGARTLYDFAYFQYIAKVLHPEAFADVDPLANLERFYETYLPIAADGVFMLKVSP